MPSTGTLSWRNMWIARVASSRATSWGVQTTTAPVSGSDLRQGQRNVAGSWRQVDHQVVERAPIDLAEELLHDPVEHGPAHDDGSLGFEQEAHRHQLEAAGLDRLNAITPGHRPAGSTDQVGDRGAVDVGIHQPDGGAIRLQSIGDGGGHGRFADAALSRADRDHVLDAGDITRSR